MADMQGLGPCAARREGSNPSPPTIERCRYVCYHAHMARISKNKFKVIIEHDEDGYFFASVPALPGCHTQAKTLSELTERIREAILLCLQVAKEDGSYRRKIAQLSYEPTFVGMEMVIV